MFLEPVVGAPRVFVEGEMPIPEALKRLGAQVGLDMVGVTGDFEPGPRDLALVVAGHGRRSCPRCASASRPACLTSASWPAGAAARG